MFLTVCLHAQTTAQSVSQALKPPQPPLQSSDVTAWQLRRYVVKRVPKLIVPANAEDWTANAKRLRKQVLDVAFHGWPKEWIDAAPVFEDLGLIASGKGYHLRKLRYQVVPGFQATALLYEPEAISGKMPAILECEWT